jgi:hypothetical protein
MITIRFVTCRDIVSAGIRGFEYGFWASHTEALMPDGTLLGAHWQGGVLARPHDYDKGTVEREEYVQLDATQAQTDAFYAFLRSQLGKPYDTLAIAGIVAQRDWQSPDSWFCSELQAAALCHPDVNVFPPHLATEVNHVTPRDLLLIVSGRMELPSP